MTTHQDKLRAWAEAHIAQHDYWIANKNNEQIYNGDYNEWTKALQDGAHLAIAVLREIASAKVKRCDMCGSTRISVDGVTIRCYACDFQKPLDF